MAIRISRDVLGQIRAHIDAAPDEERCGLLLGAADHVAHWLAADNVAADRRMTFEIDPATLIAAHRHARAGGAAVIGCFHSHPQGDAEPSPRDAAQAAPDGQLWLILTRQGQAIWRAGEDGLHGRFTAQQLMLTAGGAAR